MQGRRERVKPGGRGNRRQRIEKKVRAGISAICIACLLLLLSGCSVLTGKTGTSAGTDSAGETGVSESEAAGDSETDSGNEKEIVLGVSLNSLRSPFMIALKQGIQEAADELGIEIIVSNCNGNLQTQSNQIRDFIVQEVDGILMEPLDADALIEVVEEAGEAGIPVYCVDTTVNSDTVTCTIGSDSVEMGRMAAEYIVECLYEKYGEYRGKVVNLLASVTTTSGLNRSIGFHEVIDQYPDIEIVAEQNGALQLDTAMNVMTNILQANESVDAIWCSGDTNAQGSLQAMKWLGRLYTVEEEEHIILVSADGAAESLTAIREGTMDACISQNPLAMGRMAVEMMVESLRTGEEPEESFYAYPLFTITRDNIDSQELEEYGIWSEEIES
ncbi:MAG: sugar ABC transporter substrate-binding protein [Lachnospiraceae bacterium]|nr:sugar ABC transporter substrate-binding protein [Lachnospiraceae bacterium]